MESQLGLITVFKSTIKIIVNSNKYCLILWFYAPRCLDTDYSTVNCADKWHSLADKTRGNSTNGSLGLYPEAKGLRGCYVCKL